MSGPWRWMARLLVVLIIGGLSAATATPASAGYWVQNFAPAQLWSGPDANAISFGTAPQWDYFDVQQPYPSGRLYVRVARTGNFAFVDVNLVGPSGAPPSGWPGGPTVVSAARPAAATASIATPAATTIQGPTVPAIGPIAAFPIVAHRALWEPLVLLQTIQHTWTLQALSVTGTRLDFELMPADAAGMYEPGRDVVTFNTRWLRSDPRALAAIIEHEAKHVADLLAGLDIASPDGCVTTEVNAFREEAKTWGELVGPNGKADPQDDLERSLNSKLAQFETNAAAIHSLITRNPGYRMQCRLR
jgi:hypothetical protein